MTFSERARISMENLKNRKPVSLEQARAQVMFIRYGKKGETKEQYLEKYRRGDFDFVYKNEKK